jgi:tetratricopeptide (TPR) repeat protein
MLSVSCAERPKAETVVEGFFDEVNKSNFESAKTSYLSSTLKAAIDTPSIMQHRSIRESFGQFAGHIKSLEIQSVQVNGEAASAPIVISTTWGSRSQGRIALVMEEGKIWKISDWTSFEAFGSEHMAKAASLCDARNLSSALAEYQAALAENSADSDIYTALGECYQKVGNVTAAEEQLKTAISMYPGAVWKPYIDLAYLYQRRNNFPGAEEAYKKAVQNRPDDWEPYNDLAYMYAEKGTNLDEAIGLANRALSLFPDDAYSLDTLGWAYYKKGDRSQALKYLARALAKVPANEIVLAHYRAASNALVHSGQISPAKKPAKSVRIGDLLVSANRVWFPRVSTYSSDRFHLVAVDVTVKNISERISHTSYVPYLTVKPYEEYIGMPGRYGVKSPNLYQLLPGEESTGGYVFEVRNSTTPVALILDSFSTKLSIELAGIVEIEKAR